MNQALSSDSPTIVADTLVIASPTDSLARLKTIDILRGFAILGILLVNMWGLGMPQYTLFIKLGWWSSPLDRLVEELILFLAVGKFYCLFSFLFGWGFAQQSGQNNPKFVRQYCRRMVILLLIGSLHVLLIWWGDILHIYALLGLILLIFRQSSNKTLLIAAAICLAIPLQLAGMETLIGEVGDTAGKTQQTIEQEARTTTQNYQRLAQASMRAYAQGDLTTIFRQRMSDFQLQYSRIIFTAPQILAMFLLGLYIGRKGILQNVGAHLPFIYQVRRIGLIVGVISNLSFVISQELYNPLIPSALGLINALSYSIGTISLCSFYLAALTLLVQQPYWQEKFSTIAAVGRLALSNYLLQSLIGTMIFYHYGLALYGQIGPALCLLLSLLIYLGQVVLSLWWLRYFQFGPLEWCWRALTYGKCPPLLIVSHQQV